MDNANKPAYPQDIGAIFDIAEKALKKGIDADEVDESVNSMYGLTKRERFAIDVMQGFLSSGQMDTPNHQGAMRYKGLAQESIRYADALLKELED